MTTKTMGVRSLTFRAEMFAVKPRGQKPGKLAEKYDVTPAAARREWKNWHHYQEGGGVLAVRILRSHSSLRYCPHLGAVKRQHLRTILMGMDKLLGKNDPTVHELRGYCHGHRFWQDDLRAAMRFDGRAAQQAAVEFVVTVLQAGTETPRQDGRRF